MKLRGQLNLLLILTAIVPFVTTSIFTFQVNQAANNQSDAYMESLIMAKSIGRWINQQADQFETNPEELANQALQQNSITNAQLGFYSSDRELLHQTSEESIFATHLRPTEMMSNLFELQSRAHSFVYKEPVFLQDQVVGYYELRFDQSHVKKETRDIYLLTLLFFILSSGVTLMIVQHWFKRNMLIPFSWMKNQMLEVADGKRDVELHGGSKRRTEVGMLLDDFAVMTAQLKETEVERQTADGNRRKLIASISHDLKTPLTSIRAYAEGMQHYQDKRDEYAQVILTKTAYMQRLIEDLLIYSQIQATSFSLTRKRVDGEELAELLFDGYSDQWQEFVVRITIDIDPVELHADVDRLVQVVDNLVMNAVRYSPEGGEIHLVATNRKSALPDYVQSETGKKLYFFVIDEGQGIPSGAQQKIFDSFYQVEQSRSQVHGKGVGLGLAICRELVQKHGGEIFVFSSPPNGSSFYFSIPCLEGEWENG
ncbi:LOW QUALITY PROTEIN: two-component sensor histidine kinase [Bacillus sp. JCM 19046]|nr:LOW QUALITY PROTEIN: two-component sensor histidine kinase [Bacillus sp. JCM 19046]